MKCKWCGREFEPVYNRKTFCSPVCRYDHDNAKEGLRRKIETIARKNGFIITENKSKILEAKLMLFRGKATIKCPCASDDEDRYCGSPKCTQEIIEKGICHCHLFEKKL